MELGKTRANKNICEFPPVEQSPNHTVTFIVPHNTAHISIPVESREDCTRIFKTYREGFVTMPHSKLLKQPDLNV
jgi:hypothetical protein